MLAKQLDVLFDQLSSLQDFQVELEEVPTDEQIDVAMETDDVIDMSEDTDE